MCEQYDNIRDKVCFMKMLNIGFQYDELNNCYYNGKQKIFLVMKVSVMP